MYSILADVQCADEKGKGKEASPEWGAFQVDSPSAIAGDDGSSVAAGKDDVISNVDDVEEGKVAVMSPECQDPLLSQTYLGLPLLP